METVEEHSDGAPLDKPVVAEPAGYSGDRAPLIPPAAAPSNGAGIV